MANKLDQLDEGVESEVSDQEIADFTKRTGIEVYKCSAKTGQSVESTFLKLTETLISKTQPNVYGSSAADYVGPGQGGEAKTLFQQKQRQTMGCCGV